jgi:hypothetical protein
MIRIMLRRLAANSSKLLGWALSNVRARLSKYHPAEPGPLRFEPLKAAVAASHVTLIRLIASPTALENNRSFSRALTNRTSFAPCFASAACVPSPYQSSRALSLHTIPVRQAYSWKCQTATATPAEPGELPLHLLLVLTGYQGSLDYLGGFGGVASIERMASQSSKCILSAPGS